MKALTVLQPWASAIACGAKRIETRSWSTDYRGPLLIHAGKSRVWLPTEIRGFDSDARSTVGYAALGAADLWDRFWPPALVTDPLPFGAIIAVADLVDCGYISKGSGVVPALVGGQACTYGVSPKELALGDYTPGRYGWVLSNVCALPQPIPYRGAQRLFNVPDELIPEECRLKAGAPRGQA